MHRKVHLNQVRAFTVVLSCLMSVLSVALVLFFSNMYVSILSHIWIPESLPIWKRAADSVYQLSHLFTDVTSSLNPI